MENIKENKKEVLKIEDLSISFYTPVGEVKAVDSINYTLHENEIMGIVGESGSGKSVESYGIMGLLQEPGKVKSGKILFKGENVLDYDKNKMSEFRGAKCSMIFQNPMTCLNPVYTIGNQLMEALLVHKKCSKDEAYQKAVDMLDSVGISNPKRRMKQYPHELSGGMRQRVMIGMGLICEPDILIADEPTTALDVTIQAQILELIKEFQNKSKMSVIFITHNLAVVAQICDTVSVMYAGRIVEQGSVEEIFYNPKHPYTKGLLKSMPRIDSKEQVRLESIKGTPVDMLNPPEGCGFSTRCEHCMNICLKKEPPMLEMGNGHRSKCFLHIKESINGR
ncbi:MULTISPECIES: ABC transporter ATP-binding protein [Anaerococcus]|uniref:Oligopeptide transport ATP-binding protein OppD n=1 Tax=Anaerococcus vaginalis TaxID=33037 RepID=A0A6N2RBL7_9FIRM|nr:MULTISPECIES: ABC transporter ATP-binding protein [Anaerococcus]MBS4890060.1 ABC transporter ATP-binding protein [Anaerococcus vaginalis]MDU1763671.1 ABC transporter ATP-binding protein [Anaerococcus vaginalis]MDU2648938.1 ABC transporter ATP-binding protein [Anaerococcus vaginalis]MDU4377978.1 ABC transporter ATP-binding protein [Anaerococcus vaginalis]MDU4448074.1 ABC transporter ATP-binding protein [Anaerococcus vaginalis]